MPLPKDLPSNLTIPTLPSVVLRINGLLADQGSGTGEIGAVIAQDAPLSAKVLRIANSAFYGLRQPCVSAEQASAMLGVRVLRNVVMQAAVIRQFDHLVDSGFDLDELWKHSVSTGQACSFLARKSRKALGLAPDDFYSCGLLHDLGQVVLLDGLGKAYVKIVCSAAEHQLPVYVMENRALGYNHTDIGALVAERWGLPAPVTAAIRDHHGPREAIEASEVTSLVANTNLLMHHVAQGSFSGAANVFDAQTMAFLGLGGQDVIDLIEYLRGQVEAMVV